ncbi:putative glycolipid-binding domain-containing protein [Flavobacterium sp. MFBS3-15]|uniref:putative glycolipid-binding domain-containing protein n=1 Tax=Flavobacterium sp. MFBS3-15 TaxID=2989816 RepID=UPI002235E923|nr:putative glycolipid-binding domain-containing protein [Flavobacterium sp. MFBS3-15]MCW4467484.1 putative glycolipid-binding domain-containing protein [Flavobacterium sp. MFBS3-15]
MQKSIVWEGLANDTEEHCSVNFLGEEIVIRSEIEGWAAHKAVYAEYVLHLTNEWEAVRIEVDFHVSDHQHSRHLQRDGSGNWTDNSGKAYPELQGCLFLDISLTPLTNSLPINALHLSEGDSAEFDLAYFDILEDVIRKDRQKYTRMPGNVYRFENGGGSFTADIAVDADGFVTEYPNLFKMLKPR